MLKSLGKHSLLIEAVEEGLRRLALDGVLTNVTEMLRRHTRTPEPEIEHFAALVRAAYEARLAFRLWSVAGRA